MCVGAVFSKKVHKNNDLIDSHVTGLRPWFAVIQDRAQTTMQRKDGIESTKAVRCFGFGSESLPVVSGAGSQVTEAPRKG